MAHAGKLGSPSDDVPAAFFHAPASLPMPRCCRLPYKILPDVPYILARSVSNCTILHQPRPPSRTNCSVQAQRLSVGSQKALRAHRGALRAHISDTQTSSVGTIRAHQ